MVCTRAIHSHSWTLCSLVGAYLDLALAYLLLCGAALAFITAKFLALFGLALPCPCDGLFGGRPQTQCLLVDYPTAATASVHATLRCRSPFDSIFTPARHHYDVGHSDESCGSVSSNGRAPDAKGEGDLRRRRAAIPDQGKPPSVLHSRQLDWQGEDTSPTPFVFSQLRPGDSSTPADSETNDHIGFVEGSALTKCKAVEKNATHNAIYMHGSEGNEAIIIRDLERALEEEQAARVALYLELEKERSSAATAADEAMAMILRLQEEKAVIAMEARQYHRMIEEKSAYDEEEMGILKEIIVMREMEKHVLEKEVEAYRQMVLTGGQAEQPLMDDMQLIEHTHGSAFDLSEDPLPMLQQIYESIGKKESKSNKKQSADHDGHLAGDKQDCVGDLVIEPSSLGLENASSSFCGEPKQAHGVEKHHQEAEESGNESNLEFQEKGMVTMDVYTSSVQNLSSSYGKESILYKLNKSKGLGFQGETSQSVSEEDGASENKIEIRAPIEYLRRESDVDHLSQFEAESRIHDVHIIDDRLSLGDVGNGKESNLSQMECTSSIYGKSSPTVESSGAGTIDLSTNSPVTNWAGMKQNIHKSCSDMTMSGKLMDDLCDNSSYFGLRRSSMSVVDIERTKLGTEVELLRKKLKIIQQEREKLNFSVEHREKESFQLQLLDEIARQLQEIRKITEPERSVRHASLPLPSSKSCPSRCREKNQ